MPAGRLTLRAQRAICGLAYKSHQDGLSFLVSVVQNYVNQTRFVRIIET